MKTFDLVKSQIERLDKKVNSYEEIEAACPVIKRQVVNNKMEWILNNPETQKWAIITEEQVEELSNIYHVVKTGMTIEEDPFILKS